MIINIYKVLAAVLVLACAGPGGGFPMYIA